MAEGDGCLSLNRESEFSLFPHFVLFKHLGDRTRPTECSLLSAGFLHRHLTDTARNNFCVSSHGLASEILFYFIYLFFCDGNNFYLFAFVDTLELIF